MAVEGLWKKYDGWVISTVTEYHYMSLVGHWRVICICHPQMLNIGQRREEHINCGNLQNKIWYVIYHCLGWYSRENWKYRRYVIRRFWNVSPKRMNSQWNLSYSFHSTLVMHEFTHCDSVINTLCPYIGLRYYHRYIASEIICGKWYTFVALFMYEWNRHMWIVICQMPVSSSWLLSKLPVH